MAVFKPTDCSPFSGCFDMDNDKPIFLECKVDTSNTVIKGFKINVYDENNGEAFVGGGITTMSDLKIFADAAYPEYTVKYGKDLNTGINGTNILIPFIGGKSPAEGSSVSDNIYDIEKGTISNGHNYTWYITLYQTTEETLSVDTKKYYDMPVCNGQIMGSTNKRIQTKKIMDGVSIINKFIQPVKVRFDSGTKFPEDIDTWNGSLTQDKLPRLLVEQYDPTYGYIYPTTTSDSSFPEDPEDMKKYNAFQIYKMGNNRSNLTETDMVDMIIDKNPENTGAWDFSKAEVTTVTSAYLIQKITVTMSEETKPSEPYAALPDNISVYSGQRILFNAFKENGIYNTSPFNGVYVPSLQEISDPVKKESGGYEYTVTLRWQRPSDLDSWGELMNKVLYNKADGQNYEVNKRFLNGEINQTPLRYVKEKPIRIYEGTSVAIEEPISELKKIDFEEEWSYFEVANSEIINEISVIEIDNMALDAYEYTYEVGSARVYVKRPAGSITGSSITYTPRKRRYYTGIILYTNDDNKKLYLRPSTTLENGMMLQKLGTGNEEQYFQLDHLNMDYYCVDCPTDRDDLEFDVDDRYQVRTYFKQSDANPVQFRERPKIKLTVIDDAGDKVTLDDDNKECTINTINADVYVDPLAGGYEQENFAMWRCYQWNFYSAENVGGTGTNIQRKDLLSSESEKYDGKIERRLCGLENGEYYILDLIIITNDNYVFQQSYNFYGNATTDDLEDEEEKCEIKQDPISSSAVLSIVGKAGYTVSIYRRDVWYDRKLEYKEGYSGEHNEWTMLTANGPNDGTYWDYGVKNHHKYEYMVYYSKTNSKVNSNEPNYVQHLALEISFNGWYVIELHKPDPSRIVDENMYVATDKDVWHFRYNIEPEQQAQNVSKEQIDTLARYPAFSHGPKNHMSGSVSCLLGREFYSAEYVNKNWEYAYDQNVKKYSWREKSCPVYNAGGYTEELGRYMNIFDTTTYKSPRDLGFTNLSSNAAIDMLDAWREVCASGNPKLLKDEKGQAFLIQISNPSNTVNETWGERYPTSISFDWVEIGPAANVGTPVIDGKLNLSETNKTTNDTE